MKADTGMGVPFGNEVSKMGDTGLEQSVLTGSKTPISQTDGTESGTVNGDLTLDSDLEAVLKAWSSLPENIKKAIRALIG